MAVIFLTHLIVLPAAALCLFPMKNQLRCGWRRTLTTLGVVLAIILPVMTLASDFFALPPNTVLFPALALFFSRITTPCGRLSASPWRSSPPPWR